MLINFISTDNYNSFNIELAHLIGLHEAIYLNELININQKAIRKNKVSDDDYFIVDREYIKTRTTIDVDEQKEIDKALEICNIIELKDKNYIHINLDKLTTMVNDGNEVILKRFVKEVKDKKKTTKAEIIRQNLKNNIFTVNEELRNAYCEWIDSVCHKRGYMAKKAVIEGQRIIDDFSKHNLDVALKVISIATINSYVDMNWAINNYKQTNKLINNNPVPTIQSIQQLSKEVF